MGGALLDAGEDVAHAGTVAVAWRRGGRRGGLAESARGVGENELIPISAFSDAAVAEHIVPLSGMGITRKAPKR